MTMIDRIKSLAQSRNMSIYDLEDALDFGRNTIYQWDKRKPSFERVQKVADYFNVSIDYLVGNQKDLGKIIDVDASPKNEENVLLRTDMSDIPEEKRDDMINDIKKYINLLKKGI